MEGSRQVAGNVFSRSVSRTPIAHLANAPPPIRVSRPLHAACSRTGQRDALPACTRSGLSDGSPPECAVIAQIAHRKYAAQYARLVRIWVRTDSRIALRFAPSNANLVRTRPPDCYQKPWLPGAGFHCGFQGFAVFSTDNLASCEAYPWKTIKITIPSGLERPFILSHDYS